MGKAKRYQFVCVCVCEWYGDTDAPPCSEALNERDAELRRERARVGELEAYYKEKVERLQKTADDARRGSFFIGRLKALRP